MKKHESMKKSVIVILFLLAITAVSAQQTSLIENILANTVEEKVASMQELIGFTDDQADQLRAMELTFLQEVNKAEHCFLCNTKKRVEKLKRERDAKLQTILHRDQYIQYDAVENNRVKKHPIWLK